MKLKLQASVSTIYIFLVDNKIIQWIFLNFNLPTRNEFNGLQACNSMTKIDYISLIY